MSSPLFFSLLCLFVFFFIPATSIKCILKLSSTAKGDHIKNGIGEMSELLVRSYTGAHVSYQQIFEETINHAGYGILAAIYAGVHYTKESSYIEECTSYCCQINTMWSPSNRTLTKIQGCGNDCYKPGLHANHTKCDTNFCNMLPGDKKPTEKIDSKGMTDLALYMLAQASVAAIRKRFRWEVPKKINERMAKFEDQYEPAPEPRPVKSSVFVEPSALLFILVHLFV